MTINSTYYDITLVGGGLAGLSISILLAKSGYRVVLFEKEAYPFHKVCGEYISFESWEFLSSLGLPLNDYQLPRVDTLTVSSPNGSALTQKLPLGGFGISRYTIDNALVDIAKENKVDIYDNTRVQDIVFEEGLFVLTTDKGIFQSRVCCGAFGKRSNIDVKWKRDFIQQKAGALNNYIGVKYHARLDHPRDLISLHHFKNGYCGIAPIEDDKTCVCYLTTAHNLQLHGNSIKQMEEEALFKNPFLKQAFSTAGFLYDKPLTISQISFNKKKQVENHVLLLGDAAGLITPLCGNGMSMALHSSYIAAPLIMQFFEGKINRHALESSYTKQWQSAFSNRLFMGRALQSLFGKEWVTNSIVSALRHFPGIVNRMVRQTHGTKIGH